MLDGWLPIVTYRQQKTWNVWLELQWNRPTRTDYYLMQIHCEIRRILAKDPSKHQLKNSVLDFKDPKAKPSVTCTSISQRTSASKAAWFGHITIPPTLVG